MASESAMLLSLGESIAEGLPIDWEAAETRASDEERAVVYQLRVLAELAVLHGSLPVDPGDLPTSREPRRINTTPAIGNWGHLVLVERLGGGAFGEVYRAWDRQLEREVALKLLRPQDTPEDPQTSRIAREGRLLARVRHPNVITVYGVGVHDGRVGIWMELIRGATLEDELRTRGPFSAREAALMGVDLCRSLAAIHAAGLIHRDVKAQNVMREEGGRTVLMDLGTSHEIGVGDRGVGNMAGTPLYLAPEILLHGAPASTRTDIYSLGVLLYRLVTRAFPIRTLSVEELVAAHARGTGVKLRDARADLPTRFVSVVDRAIANDPAQRHGSVGELETDLVRALEDSAAPRAQKTVATPAPARKFITWQNGAIAATLAVIVALAALFWPMFNGHPPRTAVPGVIHSVAVLPLVNLSGDPSQEYFADGMTDELIARLGRLPGLDVISRTSVMTFKRSSRSLPEIARTLGVDAVLEGSVLVVPAAPAATRRVRINARLIAAGTDTQLWDRTFETVVDDLLALQSQVAKAVVDGIHLRLSSQQQGTLARAGSENRQPQDFEAFDLYLRGRYYWNLRTTDGLNRSLEYFQKAIDRYPDYASAYAGLADAYVLLGALGTMPYEEALTRASTAATKAIALDDSLAEAHASLGLVQHNRLEWEAAESSFKRALDLNPGYARAYHWRAAHLTQRGRFADATSAIQKALELDPLSASVHTQAAAVLFLSRRYDETIERAQKALLLDPTFARAQLFVAEAYAQKLDYARAVEAIEKAAAIRGRTAELQAFLGCTLALAGRQPEARKAANELIDRYRRTQEGGSVGIALVYACLRDNDRAFEWLERARSLRDPWLGYLKVDPFFDNLHADPRYTPLLAALGLTQ